MWQLLLFIIVRYHRLLLQFKNQLAVLFFQLTHLAVQLLFSDTFFYFSGTDSFSLSLRKYRDAHANPYGIKAVIINTLERLAAEAYGQIRKQLACGQLSFRFAYANRLFQ